MIGGDAGPDAAAVSIARERPDSADVLELFRLADEYGLSLYPAESYHALDRSEFVRPEVELLVARRGGRAVGIAALVLPDVGAAPPAPSAPPLSEMKEPPTARPGWTDAASGRDAGSPSFRTGEGAAPAEYAEVKRMFVHPHARGLGLARRLLGELERRAAQAGVTVIRLETGPPQFAALSLYEASGYRPIPLFGPYVGDPQSLCFEKRLSRPAADPVDRGRTSRGR